MKIKIRSVYYLSVSNCHHELEDFILRMLPLDPRMPRNNLPLSSSVQVNPWVQEVRHIFDTLHSIRENVSHLSLCGAVIGFSYVPRGWEAGVGSRFLSHWKWLLQDYFYVIAISSFKQGSAPMRGECATCHRGHRQNSRCVSRYRWFFFSQVLYFFLSNMYEFIQTEKT